VPATGEYLNGRVLFEMQHVLPAVSRIIDTLDCSFGRINLPQKLDRNKMGSQSQSNSADDLEGLITASNLFKTAAVLNAVRY
jgi:hypothetical protein